MSSTYGINGVTYLVDAQFESAGKKTTLADRLTLNELYDKYISEKYDLKPTTKAGYIYAYNHYVSILDISKDGKKVLVSNSYGTYDNIPTGWVKVSYMKKKFSNIGESLIVKLNYKLSDSTKNKINNYYSNMGKNWVAKDTHQSIGGI